MSNSPNQELRIRICCINLVPAHHLVSKPQTVYFVVVVVVTVLLVGADCYHGNVALSSEVAWGVWWLTF